MASIPAVLSLERRFEGRGLRFIGVTSHCESDEERAAVETSAKEHKMTSPTYLDAGGAFAKTSGLGNNPSFLVIGRDGRSMYRHQGTLKEGTESYDKMAQALERALASK